MSQKESIPLKILIVDDEPILLRAISLMLKGSPTDVEVTMAGDARAAVEASEQQTFDLAIVDMVLPDMEGSKLATCLREVQSKLPILYISGYGADIFQRQGVATPEAFLQKPFSPEQLLENIQQALHKEESR